ncbi:MAG: hypothetical protein IJ466_11705 [Clostridia bacterium]|nr:hypothetical protein [Clostridia bacterium]
MKRRNYRLRDEEVADFIKSERRYNEHLRQRRAASINTGESKDVILHYDGLIYSSDRRLITLYAKSRLCCNTDGER